MPEAMVVLNINLDSFIQNEEYAIYIDLTESEIEIN